MIIRRALPGDLDAIRACARAAFGGYAARIGRKPAPMGVDFAAAIAAGHLHVAIDETATSLCGYVFCYPSRMSMHLDTVAVDPARQGKGIGQRLIAHVEERARRAGLGAVELYTNAKMTENLTLYPRLGYVETGRRIEDGFDRVYFRKDLAP